MRLLTLVIFCVAISQAATAQTSPPSDGSGLQGWKVEFSKAEPRDGVLHVGKGNGWVRTERVFADFTLSLYVRIPADRSVAIFVRSWPTFSKAETPTNGYRLQLTGAKRAPQSEGWQRLQLECVGQKMTVRVDGELVDTVADVGNPQGYIALSAPDETVQFRAIEITQLPPPRSTFHPELPDVMRLGNSIQAPRLLKRPSPRYTAAAMRARISGTVRLQAVVLPDGTIGDVQILQSLDPKFGLDQAAIENARQWTFAPGTSDGKPVAVRIMLELDFNLR